MKPQLFGIGVALALISCGGTTGGGRVVFQASAAGPLDASGTSLEFTNGLSYHVLLTRARLHVGAVYFNQSVPTSGAQAAGCFLPGIYVGQVPGSVDVDALSSSPQPFPVVGEANAIPAKAGELWLTGGDVNQIDDTTVILDVAGIADKAGISYPFQGSLTIGRNRFIPSTDPAFPNLNPICRQRIVSPILIDFTPRPGGQLLVRVDPRGWFGGVDFATLRRVSDTPLLYQFADSAAGPADIALYNGLRARIGAYQFIWQ
jgi:hypothetical protein